MRRNILLALLSGVLAAFAFPNPFFIGLDWPGGFLAFICLVPLLAIREPAPGAFAYWRWGGLAGAVYFGFSIYWMSYMPALGNLAPLAWSLVTLYLALYPALFLAAYRLLLQRGLPSWAIAAPLWVGLEFFRNYLMSGFPWAALGYAHYRNPLLMSLAPFTGVWGLSLVTVWVNSGLYELLKKFMPALAGQEQIVHPGTDPALMYRRRFVVFVVWLLVIVAGGIVEHAKLSHSQGEKLLTVAALQGNIDQNQPWTPLYQRKTMSTYFNLGQAAVLQGAQLLVWPESGFPGIFNWDYSLANELKSWSLHWHVLQAVGADTMETADLNRYRYYNSLVLVGVDGRVNGVTSKIHLVPFGEYVPYKDTLLFFISKLVNRYGAGNFTPGTHRTPMTAMRSDRRPVTFGSLVCFESLFPQYAARLTRLGSEFLVVVTLDTWFGKTAAAAQHAIFSALRAAENGRFLVRSAATGISCVFDPRGRLLRSQPLNTEGVLVMPIRCRTQITTYTRFGPWVAWFCLLLIAWDFRWLLRKRGRPRACPLKV